MIRFYREILIQIFVFVFCCSNSLLAQDLKNSSCISIHNLPSNLTIKAGSDISSTISFHLSLKELNELENRWVEIYGRKGFKRTVNLVFFLEDEVPMGNSSVPTEYEQSLSEIKLDIPRLYVGWNRFDVKSKLSPYLKGNYRASVSIKAEPIDPLKGYGMKHVMGSFRHPLNGCSKDTTFKVENNGHWDLFGPARYSVFLQRPAIVSPKEEYVIGDMIPLSFYGFDANTAVCSQETKGQGLCKDGFAEIILNSKNKDARIDRYEVKVPLFKSKEDYGYKKLYEVYTMNLEVTKRMPEGENFISLRVYDIAGNNHTIYPYGKINVKLK